MFVVLLEQFDSISTSFFSWDFSRSVEDGDGDGFSAIYSSYVFPAFFAALRMWRVRHSHMN